MKSRSLGIGRVERSWMAEAGEGRWVWPDWTGTCLMLHLTSRRHGLVHTAREEIVHSHVL